MLEEDLRTAIADANDLGHFFLLMEHMGYEISHGNRLGFRLRGQERFMIPGRKNPLFTEDGIRAAIQGNLAAIEAGRGLPSSSGRSTAPTRSTPGTPAFWPCMSTISIYWGRSASAVPTPHDAPALAGGHAL